VSYILDALKRSEQEDRNRQAPALDAVHVFSPARTEKFRLTILFLASLLLVATGTALYLFLSTQGIESNNFADAAKNGPIRERVAPAEAPIALTPLAPDSTLAATSTTIAVPVQISELPESVQRNIPEMRFSSHIFAEDSTLRLVNINGNNIREGDIAAKGIRLVEITEEGVLLRYQDQLFEMSVLRDWTID